MAGNRKDFKARLTEFDCLAGFQKVRDFGRGFVAAQTVGVANRFDGRQHWYFTFSGFNLQPIRIGYKAIAKYVIEVAVGIEQAHGLPFFFFYKLAQYFFFLRVKTTGIDDQALLRCFVADEVGVFLKIAEGENLKLTHGVAFETCKTMAANPNPTDRTLDADYWQNRYRRDETGWDMGHAAPPLAAYIETLEDRSLRVLVPGAGRAYELDLLWQRGFRQIFALDWAADAIDAVRKRLPDLPENQLIQADFFNHSGHYDLILENTFFCALDPALRSAYAEKMYDLLASGGHLVGLLFDTTFEKTGPPFGGNRDEYRKLFAPYFEIKTLEPASNSHPARAGREVFFQLCKPTE